MHRNKQGGEPLLLNALPVGGGEVGERQIRAVKKTEAVVVVFEVEAAAAPRRLLIDETEGAGVVALLEPVEQGLGEAQAQAFVEILLQLHRVEGAAGIFHLEGELLLPDQKLQVDQIPRAFAVDAEQPIAGLKAELFADGAWLHRGHHGWGRQPGGRAIKGSQGNPRRGLIPHGGRGCAKD